MLSDLLHQKFVKIASLWDADGDGLIEKEDYAIAAGRLAGLAGYQRGSDEFANLYQQLLDGGWELLKQFDSDGDGRVSEEESVQGLTLLLGDRERLDRTIIAPTASTFDLADSDHDGKMTADDYRAYITALGVDPAAADGSFPVLDNDGDGFVTREEFTALMEEYFTSDDPAAPGNSLFGKM